MLKRFSSLVVILACLLSASNSYAAFLGGKSQKVATIDLQRIEKESSAVLDLISKLQQKQQNFQIELEKEEKDVQRIASNLQAKRSKISKAAYEQKKKELTTRIASIQVKMQDKNTLLENTKNNSLEQINRKMKQVIENLSATNKYLFVMPSNVVLYYDKKEIIDITDQVLKQINEEMKTVDLSSLDSSSSLKK